LKLVNNARAFVEYGGIPQIANCLSAEEGKKQATNMNEKTQKKGLKKQT